MVFLQYTFWKGRNKEIMTFGTGDRQAVSSELNPSLMDEEVLLIEQSKTDPDAFGRLYDLYYQPVFGFLLSRTHNVEVAKDLTSETFFQALKGIRHYTPQGKPFKSWLFAIAMAQTGAYYRSRSRYLSVTLDESPELVAHEDYQPDLAMQQDQSEAEIQVQLSLLRQLIGKLNQKQQNILTMRFSSQLSIPEIAAAMGMKEGTVKSHIHRAVKKLQSLMAPQAQETSYEPESQHRTTLGTLGSR